MYGTPSAAGVPSRRRMDPTDTSTSATTVMMYGSAAQNSVGMLMLVRAWMSNPSPWNAPNRYAPSSSSSGRQNEKITSAIAIHPAPAVMPSIQFVAICSVNTAPATPASAPPISVWT